MDRLHIASHSFSINDQFGDYWFFVDNPNCPDEILERVLAHFQVLLLSDPRRFMQFNSSPVAKAEMQIRKPLAEVFEAFVNPGVTSRFWFTKGSARLDRGKEVQWDWEMYKFSVKVKVKELEQNKRIVVEWSAYEAPTTIEWNFKALPDNTTFVSITNYGFVGDGDTIIKQATNSTEGFAFVLAGAKAYLEHNIELNLVRDRFPEGLQ